MTPANILAHINDLRTALRDAPTPPKAILDFAAEVCSYAGFPPTTEKLDDAHRELGLLYGIAAPTPDQLVVLIDGVKAGRLPYAILGDALQRALSSCPDAMGPSSLAEAGLRKARAELTNNVNVDLDLGTAPSLALVFWVLAKHVVDAVRLDTRNWRGQAERAEADLVEMTQKYDLAVAGRRYDEIVAGRNPSPLRSLVDRFAVGLYQKLVETHQKRGYPDDHHPWMSDRWADDLRAQLRRHVGKGDPLDVAAYCAFAWHHGWSLASDTPITDAVTTEEFALLRDAALNLAMPDGFKLEKHTGTAGGITYVAASPISAHSMGDTRDPWNAVKAAWEAHIAVTTKTFPEDVIAVRDAALTRAMPDGFTLGSRSTPQGTMYEASTVGGGNVEDVEPWNVVKRTWRECKSMKLAEALDEVDRLKAKLSIAEDALRKSVEERRGLPPRLHVALPTMRCEGNIFVVNGGTVHVRGNVQDDAGDVAPSHDPELGRDKPATSGFAARVNEVMGGYEGASENDLLELLERRLGEADKLLATAEKADDAAAFWRSVCVVLDWPEENPPPADLAGFISDRATAQRLSAELEGAAAGRAGRRGLGYALEHLLERAEFCGRFSPETAEARLMNDPPGLSVRVFNIAIADSDGIHVRWQIHRTTGDVETPIAVGPARYADEAPLLYMIGRARAWAMHGDVTSDLTTPPATP